MRATTTFLFAIALILPVIASAQTLEDRIYGRVTTHDDVYEGFIRWDKNEASWVDILNGSKRLEHRARSQNRRREIKVFGVTIVEFDNDNGRGSSRSSGIRFGHLQSLENAGRHKALLTLRSGQEIELYNESTDIGPSVRGILVEDARQGSFELKWRDIERIDFMPVPKELTASQYGNRLYGTLTTQSGHAFSGYICWDVDEVLGEDILDGDDERGRDRNIRLDEIAALARESARSTLVTLTTGEELILHGSNDVNSDNRGILVMDPGLGQVRVPWKAFDELVFESPSRTYGYDDFYTSGPLTGTVETLDGDKFTGTIHWDGDEAASWELLDGDLNGLDFDIEMGLIKSIEPVSDRAALVTLFDGRDFELHGSNDVNEDNNGVYILYDNGDQIRVDWDDLKIVTFKKP